MWKYWVLKLFRVLPAKQAYDHRWSRVFETKYSEFFFEYIVKLIICKYEYCIFYCDFGLFMEEVKQ